MIELDYKPYRENVIVVGANQTRKTTFAKRVLIPMLVQSGHNVIAFDFQHNFTREPYGLNPYNVKKYIQDLKGEGLEILQLEDNSDLMFNNLIEKVNSMMNVVILIDELHNFVTKYTAPKSLMFLLRNCNNPSHNTGYIALFQRPAEVISAVGSNSTHRYCFLLDLPTDVDYVQKWFGQEVERFKTEDTAEGEYCYKRRGRKGVQWGTI